MRKKILGLWLCVLGAIGANQTAAMDTRKNACIDAARAAASRNGIPPSVLVAISLAETGRKQNELFEPWPWTINVKGKGYWLDTKTEAEDFIRRLAAQGIRSFDSGCFQINYRWHPDAFSDPTDMLDPNRSAQYAAEFLTSLWLETGNWNDAAGLYHSRTPNLAQRYRTRFVRIQKTQKHLDHEAPQALVEAVATAGTNPLRAPVNPSTGSLFSGPFIGRGSAPLLAAANHRLWGG